MVAHVLLELQASNLARTFTYLVPDQFVEQIKVGSRVKVPFGRQNLEGFVLELTAFLETEYKLKEIKELIDKVPVLNQELLELGKFIKRKTLCNLISAYQCMLPKGMRAKQNQTVTEKYVSYLCINKEEKITSVKQQEVLDLFKDNKEILKKEATRISVSAVNTLLSKNILKEIKKEEYRLSYAIDKLEQPKTLSTNQQDVLNKIIEKKHTFAPFLLHGVTGSGKTEVYMQLIQDVIERGKEAIVLVPEISLTPQFIQNFKQRFGNRIAVLHSGLSNGEKYDEYRKIQRKEVSIVIGARSAIFAPLTNIGSIIVDEEHSSTYKQENNPKYYAIDIAIARARYHQCPLILGSATPSLESYTRALTGTYQLLEMKQRINQSLPIVKCIDMKQEIRKGNFILSSILREKIIDRINKNEQVIILLNRRGYTRISSCKNCGFTHKCPNCDIPLVYHKKKNYMNCHYCGYTVPKLETCPTCHSNDMNSMGMGTEKLEQYIKENIPGSKTLRMDNDTTSRKGSHERLIKSFQNGEYNILIGTQMIAKGLDFPQVSLVGVISADITLNIPDFRSSERTFQLLNQVAGRAGRGDIPGEVIIQGFNVEHYSILYASNHDYLNFYKSEMHIRKQLKYSPYFNLSLIKIKGKQYEKVEEEATKIAHQLRNQLKDVIILGPSSGMLFKINNIYELQIILKYKQSSQIIEQMNFLKEMYSKKSNVIVDIDLYPLYI